MNRFLLAALLLVQFPLAAQQVILPYNPDSNQDSVIGAPDLLDFLPYFGGSFLTGDVLVEGQTLSEYISFLTDTVSASSTDTVYVLLPSGSQLGQMLFWDGGQWNLLPAGISGESLFFEDNIPVWKSARTGCTNDSYFEFDPNATVDDGSCATLVIPGCIDSVACNFSEAANDNDGSCLYPYDLYGIVNVDCDGNCFDFDYDGICNEDEVVGCMNPASCNYEQLATDDSGTCEGTIDFNISFYSWAELGTMSWSLYDENNNLISSGENSNGFVSTQQVDQACSSCYSLTIGPAIGYEECIDDTCSAVSACILAIGDGGSVSLLSYGNSRDTTFCIVDGCTDSSYLEFDEAANNDDGSCLTLIPDPVVDCVSPQDWNYFNYDVVQIGSQCWFAENLRTDYYNTGEWIPRVAGNTDWMLLGIGARCEMNNSNANIATYGNLYNKHAILSGQLCPYGWHVSTLDDWQELEQFVEGQGFEGAVAAALKSSTGWYEDGNGTDDFGFTIRPSGGRTYIGGYFLGEGVSCEYWLGSGGVVLIDYSSPELFLPWGSSHERDGKSVRCVRDY